MRTEILKYGRIRDLRNDRGLTQKDVANVLHVSQNTYSQYEIGVSRYPLDAIIKLAEYYGVSIDYLVGLTSGVVKSGHWYPSLPPAFPDKTP